MIPGTHRIDMADWRANLVEHPDHGATTAELRFGCPPDRERQIEAALAYAATRGARAGKAAASWYEVGSETRARAVLAGIEDGDTAILDTFPTSDLSGQWADMMTGPGLMEEALEEAYISETDPLHLDDDLFDDLCDAYETAFTFAVESAIERMARSWLES